MTESTYPTVTGIILAGGEARRMGGNDKGLIPYVNQPLIAHVIHHLAPQVEQLLINANRNIERYQQFGYPVISDSLSGYQGPLAGMLAGMQMATTDYILTAPCDSPSPSPKLRQRMMESLLSSGKKSLSPLMVSVFNQYFHYYTVNWQRIYRNIWLLGKERLIAGLSSRE